MFNDESVDSWMSEPPSSLFNLTSRGGCWERASLDLRGPKSSFSHSFLFFFWRQDEYPLPRHFPISAPVQSQKRHQNLQKEYFELSTTQNKRIFTREIQENREKTRKIKKKRILWRKKNRENMRLLLLQGIILVSSQEVRLSVQSLNGIFQNLESRIVNLTLNYKSKIKLRIWQS